MISDIKKCEAVARAHGFFVDGFLDAGTLVIYVIPEDEVDADINLSDMRALLGPQGNIVKGTHDIDDSVFESGPLMLICGFGDVLNIIEIQRKFYPDHTALVVDEGRPGFENASKLAIDLSVSLWQLPCTTDCLSTAFV
jgi:hypothetical protein